MLLSADFLSVPSKFRFIFDSPMLEVPVDGSRIFLRFNNLSRNLVFVQWLSSTVLAFSPGTSSPDTGPKITTYIGAEMDILGIDGTPAVKWSEVPVGSVP